MTDLTFSPLDRTGEYGTPANPVRAGAIGMALHARQNRVAAWMETEGAALTAIADVRQAGIDAALARVAQFQPLHGGGQPATFVGPNAAFDLIASGLCDVVEVITPHHTHPDIAIQAMRAGLHVRIEKPLAVTLSELDRIIATAATTRRMVFSGYHKRYAVAKPRDLVRSGALGRVLRVSAAWLEPVSAGIPGIPALWNDLQTGGVILDRGSHMLDTALQFFDAVPGQATGYSSNVRGQEEFDETFVAEDSSVAIVGLPDAVCTVDVSWGTSRVSAVEIGIEIECTHGALLCPLPGPGEDSSGLVPTEDTEPLRPFLRRPGQPDEYLDAPPSNYASHRLDAEHIRRRCVEAAHAERDGNLTAGLDADDLRRTQAALDAWRGSANVGGKQKVLGITA